MTYFIILMMVGSALGFVVLQMGNTGTVDYYNGYKIRLTQEGYLVDYDGEQLEFFFSPRQLMSYNISDVMMDNFRDSTYWRVSFDPGIDDMQTMDFIRFSLSQRLQDRNIYLESGVTNTSIVYESFPVITCENATASMPVIEFYDGDRSMVDTNDADTCLQVTSQDANHRVQIYERIIYEELGIIE